MATRWYFNTDFIKIHNFNFSSLCILQDIYSWVLGKNPPEQVYIGNKKYFYLSQSYFAAINEGLIDQSGMSRLYKFYKKVGIIQNTQTIRKRFYVCFNWKIVEESLVETMEFIPDNSWFDRIHDFIRQELERESYNNNNEGNELLLSEQDMNIKPKRYTKEAELIANRIITKYSDIFNHRLPQQGKLPTKTYQDICRKIQDIYNGNFLNPRLYPLSDRCLNNKQFDVSEYRQTLKSVKGDWNKTRKLLFNSVKNFVLMFEQDRMPFNKEYLQNNLSLWLYDTFTVKGEPQSQFIQSLKEPNLTAKQLSENKADRIFEKLPEKARQGGNKLFDLCPKGTPSGTFWENISKIVEWGKIAYNTDENIQYWISSSSELVIKFADYCKGHNISVGCSTVDIERAVNCNGPWVWFVEEAIQRHGLNRNLSSCVTNDDFYNCYKSKVTDIIF